MVIVFLIVFVYLTMDHSLPIKEETVRIAERARLTDAAFQNIPYFFNFVPESKLLKNVIILIQNNLIANNRPRKNAMIT